MALQRMDNVLIVVDDLKAAKAFFVELGMELEGEMSIGMGIPLGRRRTPEYLRRRQSRTDAVPDSR